MRNAIEKGCQGQTSKELQHQVTDFGHFLKAWGAAEGFSRGSQGKEQKEEICVIVSLGWWPQSGLGLGETPAASGLQEVTAAVQAEVRVA